MATDYGRVGSAETGSHASHGAPSGVDPARLADECAICHDDLPDLDEATELCEMCFEQTFGTLHHRGTHEHR
jgi:hypothetical protein